MRDFPRTLNQIQMGCNMVNILSVLLIGAGIVIIESEASMEAVMACKQAHHVSKEQAMSGDESEEVKCFSECILKKTNIMNENNEFNEEKIKEEGTKVIKDEEKKRKFEEAAKACVEKVNAENPTGKCAKGHALFKCMRQAMPMPMPMPEMKG